MPNLHPHRLANAARRAFEAVRSVAVSSSRALPPIAPPFREGDAVLVRFPAGPVFDRRRRPLPAASSVEVRGVVLAACPVSVRVRLAEGGCKGAVAEVAAGRVRRP